MTQPNPAVDAYVEGVDERRRDAVRMLRDLCREHLVDSGAGSEEGPVC